MGIGSKYMISDQWGKEGVLGACSMELALLGTEKLITNPNHRVTISLHWVKTLHHHNNRYCCVSGTTVAGLDGGINWNRI